MYSIGTVITALGLKQSRKTLGGAADFDCPLCGGKGKLNVLFEKDIWRCNKCGEGGGVIHLVMKYFSCSKDEAIKYLRENNFRERKTEVVCEPEVQPASIEIRNDTYRTLLSILNLSDKHREELRARGFTDKSIDFYQFKTMPSDMLKFKIAKELLNKGCILEGVPGFYKENGSWAINPYPQGYLIPFVNVDGKISGFQVHNDAPDKTHGKYMSLSSRGKDGGIKAHLEPHLVGYKSQKEVYITEGALKSDCAKVLEMRLKKPRHAYLAIAGVNNTAKLKESLLKLKEMGVETICDVFDMDKCGSKSIQKNEYVEKALKKLEQIVTECGLIWKTYKWHDGTKGIDDHLFKDFNKDTSN